MILLLSAMPEEIAALRAGLSSFELESGAGREFVIGSLGIQPVVLAFSRWGKVAAATTAAHALSRYPIQAVVFTGIAGALKTDLEIGDLVLADRLFQHDLDARPFIEKYEIPLLDLVEIPTDPRLSSAAESAAREVLGPGLETLVSADERRRFGIEKPRAHRGMVASGDRFIADPAEVARLRQDLPRVLAVEMEGAAVAQVCFEHGVPCTVVRTISDRADHTAPVDFGAFVSDVASRFGEQLVRRMLKAL